MKTNYQTAIDRLNRCETAEQLDSLDTSLARIYDNGIFTESEYSRLCVKLMQKHSQLEGESYV